MTKKQQRQRIFAAEKPLEPPAMLSVDAETVSKICENLSELLELLRGSSQPRSPRKLSPPANPDVLTDIEAAAYIKATSLRSFKDWCRRWHVARVGQRRYSRVHLDAGISRQIAQGRRKYR